MTGLLSLALLHNAATLASGDVFRMNSCRTSQARSSEKFSVPLAALFRDSCSAWLISRTSTTDALRRSPGAGAEGGVGEGAGMAGPHKQGLARYGDGGRHGQSLLARADEPDRGLRVGRAHEAMLFSSGRSSSERVSAAPATFSRRCATDEVPGMSRMLGERCSSHASATVLGLASRRVATDASSSDCRGEKPPSGK